MPLPSPFHARTADLCTSLKWKTWAGTFAAASYGTDPESEFHAIRQTVAMIDVSPRYKVDVLGPDAASFLARVTSKDVTKLERGRCAYVCLCDDDGKLLDVGMLSYLDDQLFRLTTSAANLGWLNDQSGGFEVDLRDTTATVAALAVQGPAARDVVAAALPPEQQTKLRTLPFYNSMPAHVRGYECFITRSGDTGDLGYEFWTPAENAIDLWDAIADAGFAYNMLPAGLDAVDVARIEAGNLLAGVDYGFARAALIPTQRYSPFEVGLGWTVDLDRSIFIGQNALKAELVHETSRSAVGLILDMDAIERLYESAGLPPVLPSSAWRGGVPVYNDAGEQVGRATSGVMSKTLQQNLAIGIVRSQDAVLGTQLKLEILVDCHPHRVTATVSKRPFFSSSRHRSMPSAGATV